MARDVRGTSLRDFQPGSIKSGPLISKRIKGVKGRRSPALWIANSPLNMPGFLAPRNWLARS